MVLVSLGMTNHPLMRVAMSRDPLKNFGRNHIFGMDEASYLKFGL